MKSIPRKCLDRELDKLFLRGLTLDMGARRPEYARICERLITLDIQKYKNNLIADAGNLPFKDSSFDNILLTNLLEHVREPKQVVSEAYRVLKPNGLIVVFAPFNYPKHGEDYWRFTDDGLKYLLRMFRITETKKIGGFFALIGTYLDFLSYNLNLKFLQPFLNIFIFLDDKLPWIFKNTAIGFLVIAKRDKNE